MSYLFLSFGPTHSGKTTFGANLASTLGESAKFIHVDNDVVDTFIKDHFNNLRTDKAILATRTPSNPDLRLRIPQLIAGYALTEGYSVIATAAHPRRVIRQTYYKIAARSQAKVVLLIFRLSDDAAAVRIASANRDEHILDISPHGGATTFAQLYHNQKTILEEPTPKERQSVHRVFEITESNSDDVLKECARLVSEASRETN